MPHTSCITHVAYLTPIQAAPVSMRVKSFDKKMSEDEHQPRTYSDDKMVSRP